MPSGSNRNGPGLSIGPAVQRAELVVHEIPDVDEERTLLWWRDRAKEQLAELKSQRHPSHGGGIKVILTSELRELVVGEIMEWIVDANSRNKCVDKARMEYSISVSQANCLYEDALMKMKELNDDDAQVQRTLAIRRFENLYNRCIEKDDIRGAKEMQVELVKLFGLNEAEKHIHTIGMKPLDQYSQEEIEVMLKNNPRLLNG